MKNPIWKTHWKYLGIFFTLLFFFNSAWAWFIPCPCVSWIFVIREKPVVLLNLGPLLQFFPFWRIVINREKYFFPFWRIVKTHRRSQLSTINLLCLPSISITRSLPSHVHIFYPRRQTCGTPPTIFHRFDHSILLCPIKYINPKILPPSSFPIHYLPQRKFLFPSKR